MKSFAPAVILGSLLALPVSAHEIDDVEVTVLAKTTKSWNGDALPRYVGGQPEVTILRITIPPRTRLPRHKHAVINAGILLKGSLTVISDDNQALYLKAGDSIVELVDKWHYGRNDGDDPAEIVVFYAGVKGKSITIDHARERKKSHATKAE